MTKIRGATYVCYFSLRQLLSLYYNSYIIAILDLNAVAALTAIILLYI